MTDARRCSSDLQNVTSQLPTSAAAALVRQQAEPSRPTTRIGASQALKLPRRPGVEPAVPGERQRRERVAERGRHRARRHRRRRSSAPATWSSRARTARTAPSDRQAIATELDQLIDSIKTDGQHAVRRPLHLLRLGDGHASRTSSAATTPTPATPRRSPARSAPGVQVADQRRPARASSATPRSGLLATLRHDRRTTSSRATRTRSAPPT